MKILGIDPGMAIVGYSILDFDGTDFVLLHSGSIKTDSKLSDSKRLLEIFNDISTWSVYSHLAPGLENRIACPGS